MCEVALVDHELQEFIIANGGIEYTEDTTLSLESYIQPASVDVPIGSYCLLMRDKVLPFRRTVDSMAHDFSLTKLAVDKEKGILLLKGQTYLFPSITVRLPHGYRGSLSPKSSIGRVDLMVRGIFDNCGLYDTIEAGASGGLWLEVSPRSFNIKIMPYQTLSQLMIFRNATPQDSYDLPLKLTKQPTLVYDANGIPLPLTLHRHAVVLSLDLEVRPVGFEAIATNKVIDLSTVGSHNGKDFFREIVHDEHSKSVTLEKDRFYILCTKERISIPVHLSAEMVPFSQHVGELRAHYAGFFDPGFGYGIQGEVSGTVGVLEVRPHETVTVYDGQPICLMEFFQNSAVPKRSYGQAGNNYHQQTGPKLAKYFV